MSWEIGSGSSGSHQKGSNSSASASAASLRDESTSSSNQATTGNELPNQSGLSRNRLRLNFGPPLFGISEDLMGSSGSSGLITTTGTLPIQQTVNQPPASRPLNILPTIIPITGSGSGQNNSFIGSSGATSSTTSGNGRPFKLSDGTSITGIGNTTTNTTIGFGILPIVGPTTSNTTTSQHHHLYSTSGKLSISPELTFDFTAEDLEDLGEIGRGAYGTVNKMLHKTSSTTIAVKRLRCTVDEREQKKLMMDLEVVMRSNACPFIVKFYGAVFKEGDCWICMELMDSSLEQFYKFVYRQMNERINEGIIGQIALATVRALSYLKEELKIIHRDVKPSNILLDKQGNIKLCDFGISGQLVDSIAQSRDAGCRPYMAPERIDPSSAKGYDIRSDVWSLGITLIEISTGKFPYPKWNSIFEQLSQVVQGDPPRLNTIYNCPNGGQIQFSPAFVDFVNTCLIKSELQRPKYARLLKHPFILRSATEKIDVKSYFSDVFDAMGPALLQQRLDDLLLYDDDDY